ncbi:MAG: hypothetical protein AB7F19_05200 [Candidatus Babeliales bacterium]
MNILLIMLVSICCSNLCAMEPVSTSNNAASTLHLRNISGSEHSDALALSIVDERLTPNAWKNELSTALAECKTQRLVTLLSQQPQPQRGFHFQLYENALEQIQAHKAREVRILTNESEPEAKCCKCCNMVYVWNRYTAPTLIVGLKVAQGAFATWGIIRAAKIILDQTPGNYIEAAANAAPAIGSLLASAGELPFSLINAWRRRILKTQQAKYEYYLLAEHSVTMQESVERTVLENQQLLKRLLAASEHHDQQERTISRVPSQDSSDQTIDEQFGEGIPLKVKK